MKKQNRLVDKLVMVHPLLTTDPADKRGQTGKVTSVVNDSFAYVAFEDGSSAAYELSGLIKLRPKKEILATLSGNVFSGDQVSTIVKIYSLAVQGSLKEALVLASGSEQIMDRCTQDCLSWLEQKNQPHRSTKKHL
jgi:hypothetical protein